MLTCPRFVLLVAVLPGLAAALSSSPSAAVASQEHQLLGACPRDSLLQEPYSDWFTKNYDDYTPNEQVLSQLRQVDRNATLTIFFGSWCGDSKREVPRLFKVLDALSFPMDRVELIAVSREDSVKKQSPEGQERGQDIYRVPTMILKRDGREINRIVEYPVLSLERDLLSILSGEEYEPNYASFPFLSRWLRAGLLADENVSARGLANQVRFHVSSESELSAAAYVLMGRGQNQEAVKVFAMNVVLFPESSARRLALARAQHVVGEDEDAEKTLKRALQLEDASESQDDILRLLEEVQAARRARETEHAATAQVDEHD